VIYPISRYSKRRANSTERIDLFDDPELGVSVIGLALGFPPSKSVASVEYVAGSAAEQ
jgi:hypothetical protein